MSHHCQYLSCTISGQDRRWRIGVHDQANGERSGKTFCDQWNQEVESGKTKILHFPPCIDGVYHFFIKR
jgi:hypothetical protein